MKTRSDKIKYRMKIKRREDESSLHCFRYYYLHLLQLAYGGYLFTKAADVAAGSKEVLARGDQSERRFAAVDPKKDSISILIMGVDDSNIREFGKATRTDALILATFNVKEKSVKMLSIPERFLCTYPANA